MSSLFTPVQMGRVVLENRLVMAPMTRSRADDDGVPSDLVATYYTQRAGAGLIISEGVYPRGRVKATCVLPGSRPTNRSAPGNKSPTRCMLKAAEFSCN